MRSEKEMFDLIIRIAKQDERIRAVYMNGSRTNPLAPKDIFQDYDIVYVVTETASFIKDNTWISKFGELLMLQEPDKNDQTFDSSNKDILQSYGYLMLFTDGNRIDLHIETKESMNDGYISDSLTIPLLDKDNLLPAIPASTDRDYHIKKPTKIMYESCCNDYWWCLQNVAKGIWRDELPYAKQMFEQIIRGRLDEMTSWWIGTHHDFKVSSGKMGKYFKRYLPESYYHLYKKTFSDYHYEHIWDSLFISCELFRNLANEVAASLSFTYPIDDDRRMMNYLKQIRHLPADAEEIL